MEKRKVEFVDYVDVEPNPWAIIRWLHTWPGSAVYGVAVSLVFAVVSFMPSVAGNRLVANANHEMLPAATSPILILVYFALSGLLIGGLNAWVYNRECFTTKDESVWVCCILAATGLSVIVAQAIFNAAASCMLEMCLLPFLHKNTVATLIFGAVMLFGGVRAVTGTRTAVIMAGVIVIISVIFYFGLAVIMSGHEGC